MDIPQKQRVTDHDVTPLAKHMFDAYGEHCGWKAWDGRPMPRWEDLNEAVRSHWKAAALAALEFLGA